MTLLRWSAPCMLVDCPSELDSGCSCPRELCSKLFCTAEIMHGRCPHYHSPWLADIPNSSYPRPHFSFVTVGKRRREICELDAKAAQAADFASIFRASFSLHHHTVTRTRKWSSKRRSQDLGTGCRAKGHQVNVLNIQLANLKLKVADFDPVA